jgi:hypothetical protein
MKTMFLAAAAALLMLDGAAQAEPFVAGHATNDPQEAAALARTTDGSSSLRNAARRADDQWASAGPRLGGLRRLARAAAISMGG